MRPEIRELKQLARDLVKLQGPTFDKAEWQRQYMKRKRQERPGYGEPKRGKKK